MRDPICATVRSWLLADLTGQAAAEPAIVAHIATCPTCRALLATVSAALLEVPVPTAQSGCAACQDDLAAFVDLEDLVSGAAAAETYPHVWWHLFTCAACAQDYAALRTLNAALATGLIPQPPRRAVKALRPALALPRPWLFEVFAPFTRMGTQWGAPERWDVYEAAVEGRNLTLQVAQLDATKWEFALTVDPPLVGWARLTLGETVISAPIDESGLAVFAPVPQRDLAAPDGPDLELALEPAGTP